MTNNYLEIVKKTTIDFKEKRIGVEDFKKTFEKLDEVEIYKNLEKSGYKGISNYISAVSEIDDQSTLESQWIVDLIDLFYAYFTDNYSHICSKDFYNFLKIGLKNKNNNPIKTSFKKAIQSCLNKKIGDYCLAYIASEFLNNLKFFEKEIKEDKELFSVLNTALKLKPTKFLEDLTPEEQKTKQNIDNSLKKYLVSKSDFV